MIVAGGTGGHVYPAIALAEALCRRAPGTSVTIVGTGRALEHIMMAEMPWKHTTLQVRGVVGRGFRAAVPALLALPGAVWQSIRVLRAAKADLVIGTGAYTSPPVVVAASMLGVPRVIVELNAIPGIANRVIGPLANRVFVSHEQAAGCFRADRVVVAGTPLRDAFVASPPGAGSGHIDTILVCGGSQGAQAVNSAIIEAVQASSMIRERVTIIHQTGLHDLDRVTRAYRHMEVAAEVVPFITDMAQTLRRADLVIARCGALTLAEIAACAKPSILIPFPQATHNHQEWNARVVERAGGGIVMLQSELTGARLAQAIEEFLCHPERVRHMAEQSGRLRKTDSAGAIVDECYRLLGTRSP
ncbi:MAG: undecaprenyldiphospho-muramoylpentapeptide beta-N-acetylglucosaminyltransferase [Nitrospira sp.]|nr:undecaprenyldiphospho-muramoylpentapeptide beta-N-acetylglucosaminyltransferase [Nitrospira sp.]